MEGKELYFALASDLSERKMKERGAKFTSRESAVLRGYRFVFNTNWKDDGFDYANITPDEGSAVHGALYICQKGSMCKMDHEHIHEGNRFHRVIVKVEKRNGEVVDAIAYKANKECVKGGLKPSEIYLNEILEGEDLLPKEYAPGGGGTAIYGLYRYVPL